VKLTLEVTACWAGTMTVTSGMPPRSASHQLPGDEGHGQDQGSGTGDPFPALTRQLRRHGPGGRFGRALERAIAADPGDGLALALGGTHDVFLVPGHAVSFVWTTIRRWVSALTG